MLENIAGAIKNGQSREIGNIWFTRRGKTKQKHTTICKQTQITKIRRYIILER